MEIFNRRVDPKQLGLMAMTMAMTCEAMSFCDYHGATTTVRAVRARGKIPSAFWGLLCSKANKNGGASKSCGICTRWLPRLSTAFACAKARSPLQCASSRCHWLPVAVSYVRRFWSHKRARRAPSRMLHAAWTTLALAFCSVALRPDCPCTVPDFRKAAHGARGVVHWRCNGGAAGVVQLQEDQCV